VLLFPAEFSLEAGDLNQVPCLRPVERRERLKASFLKVAGNDGTKVFFIIRNQDLQNN